MEAKIKKIIACILGLVIIIIITCIAMLILLRGKEEEVNVNEPQIEVKKEETSEVINEVKYYNITALARKYFNNINKVNYQDREGNSYAEDTSVKESIYSMLSKEYINKSGITVDNVYEYVQKIENTISFVPTEMEIAKGKNVDKYLVKGLLMETWNEENAVETSIFVNIDNENQTFSIEPIEETASNKIQIQNSEYEIEENEYNEYKEIAINEEDLFKEKFNNFKLLIVRKSKEAYNMLDEEYREKKFGNIQAFEQYVDSNYERLSTMTLKKYKKYTYNQYEQYICIDNYGKYIIFNDKTPLEVGVLLDTYTTDLPEFTEKYKKAGEGKKVGYNIEKFISAINDKDYKFAYNQLDEIYKSKNMPTLEEFENYIKEKLYENNEIKHENLEKSGKNFIYEISVINAEAEYSQEKKLTVIMQLLEGTDFVMSFSID